MSDPQARPRHTTLAAGLVIGGSALLVVAVADRLAGLHSLDTREAVARSLDTLGGLGWSVGDGLTALRVWLMVVAGCAVVAALLALQVLRRSRGARVGLTVLAVPIFVGGLATSGFFAAVVSAAIVLLWSGPSALWLSGQPVPPRPSESRLSEGRPPTPTDRRPGPTSDPWAPPAGPPAAYGPAARTPAHAPTRRPDAVVWACVLTWSFCAIAIVVLAGSVALMAARPSLVFDQLQQSNPGALGSTSRSELIHATYVTCGVAIVWAVAGLVLATIAFRRVGWGRTALVLSAAATVVFCLVAIVTSIVMVVPAVAAAATIALLNRPEVRAWYSTGRPRRDSRGPIRP